MAANYEQERAILPMSSAAAKRSQGGPIPLHLPASAVTSSISLPRPLTSFVGRDRELSRLGELLGRDGVRLVTLAGPGGVGKTRLAIRAAEEMTAEFPDGIWFVPLASIGDARLVTSAIAQALDVEPAGSDSVEAQVASFLANSRALVILDNFEHLLDVGPVVADLLAGCPRLTILATSRAVLRLSGEYVFSVPPLDLPATGVRSDHDAEAPSEAVRLFVERAIATEARFALTPDNSATIDDICRRLDGVPLAIELAASRIVVLSPEALLARLDHRLTLLTHGPHDAPPRLRAMRDTISWSHDLLTPEEQSLFRHLSIFVSGFTLDAAEHVGGQGDRGAGGQDERTPLSSRPPVPLSPLDGITSLVEQSLVRRVDDSPDEARFGLLETIREFGLEQLALAGEEEAIRGRHAAFYVDFAERGGQALRGSSEHQASWWHRLNADIANFRAALSWLRDGGRIEDALRLAGGLDWFWSDFTYIAEGRRWLDDLLARAGETVDPAVRAQGLCVAAMLAHLQQESALSWEFHQAALRLWRAAGRDRQVAETLYGLAATAFAESRFAQAEELATESRDTAGRCGAAWSVAYSVHLLGRLALVRGETNEALAALREAITRFREVDDPFRVLSARCDEGLALLLSADRPAAYDVYRDVLETDLAINEDRGVAPVACLGLAALIAGTDPAQAARLLGAALAHMKRVGRMAAPPTLASYEELMASGRERLGEVAWDEALVVGRTLAIDEAAAEALALPRPAAATSEERIAAAAKTLGLTRRESEVLALLLERLSDREIAERLFISPRTASNHVQGVLAKLNVSSRYAAVAEARRLGLT